MPSNANASRAAAETPAAETQDNLATGSTAAPARELTLEQSLGAQIRRLRRRAELTGAELAANADLSPGMMSKIENGLISPSLATLQAVCAALNVPLSQLFSTFEERRDCSFVKAGLGCDSSSGAAPRQATNISCSATSWAALWRSSLI